MAFLLQNMFEKQGKKSLIISGDNYPHRIPMYNDAERIARFRMSGLNGLITERLYTDEVKEKLEITPVKKVSEVLKKLL